MLCIRCLCIVESQFRERLSLHCGTRSVQHWQCVGKTQWQVQSVAAGDLDLYSRVPIGVLVVRQACKRHFSRRTRRTLRANSGCIPPIADDSWPMELRIALLLAAVAGAAAREWEQVQGGPAAGGARQPAAWLVAALHMLQSLPTWVPLGMQCTLPQRPRVGLRRTRPHSSSSSR